jgi:hypothetical protein
VRAATKVFEIALAIERQGFAFRDGADQFGLVELAQLLEMGDGFVARQFAPADRQVGGGQFLHPGFDL